MITQTTTARVATDRPQRYGKQLVSHLSRRATGDWDEASATGRLTFGNGQAELSCEDDALILRLTAAAAEDLDRLEDVLGRHLVRFGQHDELVVQWVRSEGAVGTSQRRTED
jgi:uncharacterized protein